MPIFIGVPETMPDLTRFAASHAKDFVARRDYLAGNSW
jgi:hypothetical protein